MKKNKAQLDKFVQIPNNVWHSRELSDGELRTYIAIRSHRNDNDRLGTFPSLPRLQFLTGKKSHITLSRHVKKLEELGFVKIIHRFEDSNIYLFPNESKPCKCSHLCNASSQKSIIYWNDAVENYDNIKKDEEKLLNYYEHIFGEKPTLRDLEQFLNNLKDAKEILNND